MDSIEYIRNVMLVEIGGGNSSTWRDREIGRDRDRLWPGFLVVKISWLNYLCELAADQFSVL